MNRFPVTLVQDAPTRLVGSEFILGGGEQRTFRGVSIAGKHRKQIVVSNDSDAASSGTGLASAVHVSSPSTTGSDASEDGGTQTKWATIYAFTNFTLFTSDDVTIRNNGSRKLRVRVAESFYL